LATYLTAKEVADGKLNGRKDAKYVLRQAREGRLPSVRLGPKSILFLESDVDEWLQRSRSSYPVAS
jgi:excisionase family DNA binding protein